VNQRQKGRLVTKMEAHFGALKGKVIGIWGLAFKPRTDDMREAPSIVIIEELLRRGAAIEAHDPEALPEAREETRRIYGERADLVLCEHARDALQGADALAIVTEWKAFRSPDFARIRALLKTPVIFDGRNLYDPAAVEEAGLAYYGIGRGRSLRVAR